MLTRLTPAFAAAMLSLTVAAPSEAGPRKINACTTIASAGSYIVSTNLTMPAGAAECIAITASDVTLDLDGFSIIGPGPTKLPPLPYGIRVYNPAVGVSPVNVTVRDGTVANFYIGVYFDIFSEGGVVENIRVIDNDLDGVSMNGDGNVLRDSIAIGNGGTGFDVANGGSIVTGNLAYSNGGYGVKAECNSVVIGNTGRGNQFNGDLNVTGQGPDCALVDNAPPF